MFRSVVAGCSIALLATSGALAHAIFPGSTKVQTLGDRAIVQLHAVNARKDVTNFVVEVFEGDSWVPARNAVAWPNRLNVLAQDRDSAEASDKPFSVMVDLKGKMSDHFKVCTKSVASQDMLRARTTIVNTRVCSNVVVQRFQQ